MESSIQHMNMTMDIFGMMTTQEKENYLAWYRENVVLKRVVELVSGMFKEEMNDWNNNFTQDKLELFLIDNKTNINNMVEDLMQEADELIAEDEHFLGRCIMDIFDEHINIEVWISKQKQYEDRKNKGKKKVEWVSKVRGDQPEDKWDIKELKNQVVQIISCVFKELMGELFTQDNLDLFLSRNEDIIDMLLLSKVNPIEIINMIFHK